MTDAERIADLEKRLSDSNLRAQQAESRLANAEHEAEQITKRYAAYVSPEVHAAAVAAAGSDAGNIASPVVGGAQLTQGGGDSTGMPLSVGRSRPDQTATNCADCPLVEQRRLALERARGCIKGLLARTPVRDVEETLAEIDAALAAAKEKA